MMGLDESLINMFQYAFSFGISSERANTELQEDLPGFCVFS